MLLSALQPYVVNWALKVSFAKITAEFAQQTTIRWKHRVGASVRCDTSRDIRVIQSRDLR